MLQATCGAERSKAGVKAERTFENREEWKVEGEGREV
jgi:hypothetical protein